MHSNGPTRTHININAPMEQVIMMDDGHPLGTPTSKPRVSVLSSINFARYDNTHLHALAHPPLPPRPFVPNSSWFPSLSLSLWRLLLTSHPSINNQRTSQQPPKHPSFPSPAFTAYFPSLLLSFSSPKLCQPFEPTAAHHSPKAYLLTYITRAALYQYLYLYLFSAVQDRHSTVCSKHQRQRPPGYCFAVEQYPQ